MLAHPLGSGNLSAIRRMADLGVEGLEVAHPWHGGHEREVLRGLAKEWGLLTTGGSDYHGEGFAAGGAIGAATCSEAEVAALLARAGEL